MNQVSENPVKNRQDVFPSLVVIAGLMVTCYLTANIMAVKLISVFGVTIFDAGTITFPLAYMLGDVLTEVWGFKTARKVIWLTFFCNVLLVTVTTIGVFLPYPDYTKDTAEAYGAIFSYVPRITAASLFAFLGGELSNAWAMVKIKQLTRGRFLWMRTIGSSMLGYVFDTVLFVLLAFGGTVPVSDLISMIWIQYLAKLGVEAICATPLAYALVNTMRRRREFELSHGAGF